MKTPKNMRIEVTAQDIKEGKVVDPFRCPIARAAARAFGTQVPAPSEYGDEVISVITDISWLSKGETRVHRRTVYSMTDRALNWRRAFDEGEKVKPFVFIARRSV